MPIAPLTQDERYDRLFNNDDHTTLAEMAWLQRPAAELQAGDVFIKHVFRTSNTTERLIKTSAAFHVFDRKGSLTAEHAGLVGSVNNETRIMEAVNQGIVIQSVGGQVTCTFPHASAGDGMENLHKNNAYVVYRLTRGNDTDERVLHMLWQGMATRLATIQGENPPVISNLRCLDQDGAKIRQLYDAALMACLRRNSALGLTERMPITERLAGRNSDGRQATGYSIPVMVGHALPTLIPDNLVGKSNDQKYISFIAGESSGMKDICSGFAATMLQAWSVICGHGRVFTDPASIHPTGLEHHLESGHLKGWTRVGTWGRGEGHGGH